MTQENVSSPSAQTDRISRLIKQLESPNKDQRYDACEELMVSDSLPDEALKALEKATRDPDTWVADAAKAALAVHTHTEVSRAHEETPLGESQQQILARILHGLQSDDSTDRLAAIYELNRLSYGSHAIVLRLENLGISGTKAVRQAALDALDTRVSQYIRNQKMSLTSNERRAIVAEVADWEKRGLIQREQAEVLVRRYDVTRKPIEVAKPVETFKPVEPQPVASAIQEPELIRTSMPEPTEPPASPWTLSQRLLSQSAINIALYLGAFLVIGAATILAALVQEARLPILITATILFASGALVIKRRLPQPSFTLFIVFSFLLPISATVVAQTLHIPGQVLFSFLIPITGVTTQTINVASQDANAYWASVFFFMALIWGVSTWFYSSRLFSLASFAALSNAVLRFSSIFFLPDEWKIFILIIASLIGLMGVHILKGWKNNQFALPLFIAAQVLSGIALLTSLGFNAYHTFTNPDTGYWNAASLTWIAAASFYAWSGLLYSFPLFAWASSASLLPTSWLILESFNASTSNQIVGLGIWGAVYAFASEFFARQPATKAKEYYFPLLLGSLPLFVVSALWALIEYGINGLPMAYTFGVLLATTATYSALMILRPRVYVWATALVFGLGAYFTFFTLPFIKSQNIYAGYQLLGASLLLLTPELFFRSSLRLSDSWRGSPFVLGAFATFIDITLTLAVAFNNIEVAVVMGIYAFLFAAYALHFHRAWIGYAATTSAAIAVVNALQHFNIHLDAMLAILTGSAVVFFVAGIFLRNEKTKPWGSMLRISGLALGAIISFVALSAFHTVSGWYVLASAAMFFAETYIRPEDRIEAAGPLFASLAAFLILRRSNITDFSIHLLTASLIWLGTDIGFSRTLKRRRLSISTRLIGGGLALANLPTLLFSGYQQGEAKQAALIFGVTVLFFAMDAWFYREALIGYASTTSFVFAILLTLQFLQRDLWLPLLSCLAILYFASGYFLRREKYQRWGSMLRVSGLALGAVLSFASLIFLRHASEWYVLIFGALFAFETYLRREDRLEISAPIFFSMAAFLGLHDLAIREFPYHLLVISLIWLWADLIYAKTLKTRRLTTITRGAGTAMALGNALALISTLAGEKPAAICFGAYTIFFAVYAWFYRQPRLGYVATASLPLSVFFALQTLHQANWLYAIVAVAMIYYAAGFILRRVAHEEHWSRVLLLSGLGLGAINSISAPLRPGVESAIPVALVATAFAIEAFDRKNVWLAFPTNALYLEAYYLILISLKMDQPQYYSIGAAALGMVMNYLLWRAGSRTGAFIMGMASQLVLLGTTYIQMLAQLNLNYFFVLFFESMTVLVYGVVIRSRSLVIAPIGFIVLGVLSVVIYAMRTLGLVVITGVTGITLLLLGILAVLIRERISTFAERFRDWQA